MQKCQVKLTRTHTYSREYSTQTNAKKWYILARYIIEYMVRKDFSRCYVNVYIPGRTLSALTTRLNDAGDHWDKSRSAYIVKAVNTLLISEGYGYLLESQCQEKTETTKTTETIPPQI